MRQIYISNARGKEYQHEAAGELCADYCLNSRSNESTNCLETTGTSTGARAGRESSTCDNKTGWSQSQY